MNTHQSQPGLQACGKSRKLREALLSLLLLLLVAMWIGAPVAYVILNWNRGPLQAIVEGILAFGGLNLLDPLIITLEKNTPQVRQGYSWLQARLQMRSVPGAPRTRGALASRGLWSVA
ncbi:MAG TPA: hypothetical protein VGF67_02475 [Ktedonobacteraceae bacterium]|jgi:hypothetical protein